MTVRTLWIVAFLLSRPLVSQESETPGHIRSNMEGAKPGHWHISLTYGQSLLEERDNIIKAYRNSAYRYILATLSDPDQRISETKLAGVSAAINFHPKYQVTFGAQRFLNQNLAGSNWVKIDGVRPENRFDVSQSITSVCYHAGVRHLILPIHPPSRFEIAAGGGVLLNRLSLKGHQYFVRYSNRDQAAYDATSSSYHANRNSFGIFLEAMLDFYWAPMVSSQFRLEQRFSKAIDIPSQTYEYVTTGPNPGTHTKTLAEQQIKFSGFVIASSLVFHF